MKNMTPIELARQALMRLSNDKIPPTPDNYRRVYDAIAGVVSVDNSEKSYQSLEKALDEMGKERPELTKVAKTICNLIKKPDPTELEAFLRSLLSKGDEDVGVNWTTLLCALLKQLEINHENFNLSQKIEKLNHVLIKFSNDPKQLGREMHILILSWEKNPATQQTAEINHSSKKKGMQAQPSTQAIFQPSNPGLDTGKSQQELANVWRDMLIRTIDLAIAPQLADTSGASQRIEILLNRMRESLTIEEVNMLSEALKSTLLRAELQNDVQRRMQELLVQMLRLLVSSMSEMTIEDNGLHGQIKICS
ncbi:hypothetical protein [Candidatus Nitrotoga sp. M5]|uniref:hypothetical protein n=1 Tax=Candidatus Nitrotoga sp. M5 TaxID=2890409 RepID=UPI001EF3C9B8|nr:hypothetical protein [Candidatus Nitrotoga sp. M5]CAH1386907.1 hypothetical protein NTGM5_40008 [Candidatus Nitrotoga sp. M5]